MPVWIVLGVCAALFILVIVFAGSQGVFDGGMSEEEADVPPAQRLSDDAGPDEIAALKFTPTLWGYRPAEVDDAMLRLQSRIAVQDAQLAALGAGVLVARTAEADADGPLTAAVRSAGHDLSESSAPSTDS